MGARDETDRDSFLVRFEQALTALQAPSAVRRWLVAFSGGLDSSVLLQVVSRVAAGTPVVAVHIDHGLQPESATWVARCRAVADSLGVEFQSRAVAVDADAGQGLEAAAREARYRALSECVQPGDVVLTAHHADDQLETVLLRLVRGAGVRGLTGVRELLPLGDAWLARPLLDFSRDEIEAEARHLGIEWTEDPSNADTRFDRNYLRAECLPPLLRRWPHAGKLASRLARRMVDAEELLGELAELDLAGVDDIDRIPLGALEGLSTARQDNLLRHAIRRCELPVPSVAQLAELRGSLQPRDDAETQVNWPGAEARLYRQHLYLGKPLPPAEPVARRIAIGERLELGSAVLELREVADDGIPDAWARDGLNVSFRQGGERIRPHSTGGSKPLKQWFQEQGIVPWMRASIPLLYRDDSLIAIADIWIDDSLPRAPADGPFWRPVWSGHPRLY